jgi:hypothetical protein
MTNKYLKNALYSIFLINLIAAVSCVLMQDRPTSRDVQSVEVVVEKDFYSKKVEPILNSRCIACHSCLESPCQLNLQSFNGLERGGIRNNLVYNGTRLSEANMTRMFEDAQSKEEWRAMGFHDVIGSVDSSILLQSVKMGLELRNAPDDEVKSNQFCAKAVQDFKMVGSADTKMAMPYGFPGIKTEEYKTLVEWVAMGAPGPSPDAELIPNNILKVKSAWEEFLNQDGMKYKHVARYLFEHLFLANFYLESEPRFFMKLIRSSTTCSSGPKVIPSRRPNESPKVDKWYYCFVKSPGTIVDKTNIPYSMSLSKLTWIKKNFIDIPWQPDDKLDFTPEVASNPFKSFKSIPVSARYKFLLEDAHYHISTFIKGPVCNGTNAVSSIQEQFYTFFINPESDLMALSPEYALQVVEQLQLPGKWGSNVNVIKKMFPDYVELIESRNQYRKKRGAQLQNHRPKGLTLEDIWDGNGTNDNAALTIIRHGGSARVVKGAFGDLSKTAFVLDYSLFERLVYNLVVNFDVYGNFGHQFLTRVYMDLIRMEAENNFLDFLPESDRLKLKKKWYQGGIATAQKLNLFDEKQFSPIPTAIAFSKESDSQLDFVRKILFERLNEKVRGPNDPLNWKLLKTAETANDEQKQLARITSKKGKFVRPFPEMSVLIINQGGIPKRGYSIIRNRQLQNVSWIMLEALRSDPKEETLMVGRGYLGSYPNQIFEVDVQELPGLVDQLLAIEDYSDYVAFVTQYGVNRMDPRIWNRYDFMTRDFLEIDPLNAGFLDLSRYKL